MTAADSSPIARHLEIEALQEAVRWPNASPRTALVLAGQLLTARRDTDGYAYFQERAQARPDQPLLLALAGLFQVRLTDRQPSQQRGAWVQQAIEKLDRAVGAAPGLTTYFRGLALADLPSSLGKAEAATRDLEWVLSQPEQFPVGFRRNAYRSLAQAYTALGRADEAREMLGRSHYPSLDPDVPLFTTDFWITARDGFHFVSPRLTEPMPGVHVAHGYDFSDFAFVETADGLVVIDAASTEAHVQAALDDLRQKTDLPIKAVILTHAHWDHIGGLGAVAGPGVEVIAQASFPTELHAVNETGTPFLRYFTGDERPPRFDVTPDRLVGARETATIGGVDFELIPIAGGETTDGLLVHLPARGLVFTGDMLMPYLGAPFLPEGSLDGLLEAMEVVQRLTPRLLIHGHVGLTEAFPIEVFAGLQPALRELRGHILNGIREAKTQVEILQQNYLPDVLQAHPAAVLPFLVMRDNVIKRTYHQRTGYWKSDGEGMEDIAPREWAAALDLLGGGANAFVRAAETLLAQGDAALAYRLAELGLLAHPGNVSLQELRRRGLDRLREFYQQLNPFKFVIYSGLAGAELLPVQ